ncbi:transcriptional regulator, partial [Parabacteroides sp. AF19-14]
MMNVLRDGCSERGTARLSRRKRRGETLFEYFAPSYVEVRKVDGKMVNTKRPLLFNYVFIRSSV